TSMTHRAAVPLQPLAARGWLTCCRASHGWAGPGVLTYAGTLASPLFTSEQESAERTQAAGALADALSSKPTRPPTGRAALDAACPISTELSRLADMTCGSDRRDSTALQPREQSSPDGQAAAVSWPNRRSRDVASVLRTARDRPVGGPRPVRPT